MILVLTFPRGSTPHAMATPPPAPDLFSSPEPKNAMAPFHGPISRVIVNPSGLCRRYTATAEGSNFSRHASFGNHPVLGRGMMPHATKQGIAATAWEGTAPKPVQVNARVQRNSGEAHFMGVSGALKSGE